ncbi:MAG: hypothetical protein V4709_13520 [Pseudomonadota bacterium]
MTIAASLRLAFASLLLGCAAVLNPAHADDLDIYTDPTPLPAQAPLTALAIDLNLTNPSTVVCDNVLLNTTSAGCIKIQGTVSVAELFTLLGVPLPIIGGLNPTTLIADLSSSLRTILATPLGLTASLSLTQQQVFVLGLQQILTSLIDTRLTIILNHKNGGGPAPGTGACAFEDLASMPLLRQNTPACSNGAYLFAGLTNLSDPIQLTTLVSRISTALLPSVLALPGQSVFAANHPYQTKEIYVELAKYLRGDAIFNGHLGYYDYGDNDPNTNLNASFPLLSWDSNAEQVGNTTYKSGLATYPQACNINLIHLQATNAAAQDDSDAALKALFPEADADLNGTLTLSELVSSAETSGFVFGTDDRRRIKSRFIVQENLFTNGDLSELDKIGALGGNVDSYTDVLGLLGRGQDIAGALIEPLSVDTTLTSLSIAASRSTSTGALTAAYLPVFRADPEQRPAWPGNLKRFKLRERTVPPATNAGLFDVVDARDSGSGSVVAALGADGRIRDKALSIWTNTAKLGGKAEDGPVADLGGAGQNIPGFVFGGGGTPGRSNSSTTRKLYYDSKLATGNVLCGDLGTCGNLHPDDSGVRTELQAATAATAYIAPVSTCATSCGVAATACGLLCTTSQTLCTTGCTTTAAACNLLCLPGGLGNSCRTSCTNAQNTCNTGCSTTATTCNGNCGSTESMCLTSCGASVSSRDADTITRELLLHARGYDVGTKTAPTGSGGGASPTNSGITSRPWMLGAVLHSRPVAINYGKRGGSSTDVVRVVFGSADGVLHMIDDATGAEQWGFMPQAVMGALPTLRENQAGTALPYGVDGSPLVLIRDKAPTTGALASRVTGIIGDVTGTDGDRVLLFFGLRRGGAAYYALDVTDPDAPKLVWRIGTDGLLRAGQSTVDAGSAALFAPLGLAFSTPQVARIAVDLDGNLGTTADLSTRTVLVFGGGYNGGRNGAGTKIGKDFNNSRNALASAKVGLDDGSGSTDRGNAMFMIDAATGTMIWRAVRSSTASVVYTASTRSYAHPLLVDSIPSDVTVLDTDNDGLSDRLYVGDTGGRLWRADFPGVLTSAWTITPVASVGRHNSGSNTLANDRRIFFAPDYVPLRNSLNRQGTDVILFGTGDREDPLNLDTQNWFYAFRDTDLVSGKLASEIITTEAAIPQHAAGFSNFDLVGSVSDITALSTSGYRFQFTRTGEKFFSSPVTLEGTSTFTSYVPPDPSVPTARICTPTEGVSRRYSIGVRNGKFVVVNNVTSTGRDVPLSTGLPGEINVLTGRNLAAGGQVLSIPGRDTYRASWRERLGETQK